MIEWILGNKEWLFSGAGVAVVVYVMTFVVKRGLLKRLLSSVKSRAISPINPKDIYESASAVPDLRKVEVWNHYLGPKVNWLTKLVSVKRHSEKLGYVFLQLEFLTEFTWTYSISCSVRLSDCPELMDAKEGRAVRVIGRVHRIQPATIELKEVQIFLGQWGK